MRIVAILTGITLGMLSACTNTQPTTGEFAKIRTRMVQTLERTKKLEQAPKLNENWMISCDLNEPDTQKRCFIGTFGQYLDADGQAYGEKVVPFQIYFREDWGPFVQVGYHAYPGKYPAVRVDNQHPRVVFDNGGVLPRRSGDSQLVEELLDGQVARARYFKWPVGHQDMIVDLTGLQEAWQWLTIARRQSFLLRSSL